MLYSIFVSGMTMFCLSLNKHFSFFPNVHTENLALV